MSFIVIRFFKAEPFESEALDGLSETMMVSPILKRGKRSRYYKARHGMGCLANDAGLLIFDTKYYGMLTEDEVLAVGAHEFNHLIKKHAKSFRRTVIPSFLISIFIGCIAFFNETLRETVFLYGTLSLGLLSGLSTAAVSFLLALTTAFYLNAKLRREQETDSDLCAVKFAKGEALITALTKLSKRYPKSKWDIRFSKLLPITHPTVTQRIMKLQFAIRLKNSNNLTFNSMVEDF